MNALPDWLPLPAWEGYVAMRKATKKTMTPRAIELRLADLEKLLTAGEDIAAVLDQSTANNWTDLYPLKDKQNRQRGNDGAAKIPHLGKHGNATAENAHAWIAEQGMGDSIEEKKRFATLITHMADYYRSEVSRAVLGIYWNGLKHFDYEAIEKACWAHTQLPDEAGRWMPRNGDIIKMIEGGTADQAALAWTKVDQAVRTRGTYDDVVFDDPIIHRVVADMGGWIAIGSKDDKEWPFVGKEFQTRYRSFKVSGQMPDYPSRLTGIGNAHNSASGRPLLPMVLIGDPEKAKAVYKKGAGATLSGYHLTTETINRLGKS